VGDDILKEMSTQTVLLLDDDANTLFTLRAILERADVRVAESGDEKGAISICRNTSENIDLLVADVILQGSNGPAVGRKAKVLQPDMRLLFISGYSLSELGQLGLLQDEDLAPGNVEFLQKPFTPESFLASVQSLLALDTPLSSGAAKL
jgi:two-component system cell cycle sensor histidine kinase/response regulator CckA